MSTIYDSTIQVILCVTVSAFDTDLWFENFRDGSKFFYTEIDDERVDRITKIL